MCGTEFHPNSNRQKYCGDECSLIAEKEKSRKRNQKYRDKQPYGHKKRKRKGSSSLGAIANPIFEKEALLVMREMERIGLESNIKLCSKS